MRYYFLSYSNTIIKIVLSIVRKRTMTRFIKLVLFLAATTLVVISPVTYAARPLSTDDVGTVERGHLEFEGAFEYVKQPDEERNCALTLKYGLTENWDFGVEFPYKFIDLVQSGKVDGTGDINISTKYRLLEEVERLPAIAVSLNVKTETGNEDKSLGTGEIDYGLTGIFTKEIGEFTFHSNLGYTFVGGDADDTLSYGFALEYSLRENLNLVGEVVGETAFDGDFNDNPCSGLFGLNYGLNEMVVFDFGVGFEISEASPDYTITTGITLGF